MWNSFAMILFFGDLFDPVIHTASIRRFEFLWCFDLVIHAASIGHFHIVCDVLSVLRFEIFALFLI